VPKTKKCVLDASVIATLVRTKIKCGQQLCVVKLKYEVIVLCELFVAAFFLAFYCINLAHSADSTSVEQNGSGR